MCAGGAGADSVLVRSKNGIEDSEVDSGRESAAGINGDLEVGVGTDAGMGAGAGAGAHAGVGAGEDDGAGVGSAIATGTGADGVSAAGVASGRELVDDDGNKAE